MAQVESNSTANNDNGCLKAKIKDYEFELCYDPLYTTIKCCGQEAKIEHRDFQNTNALAFDLLVSFGLSPSYSALASLELGLYYDKLLKQANSTKVTDVWPPDTMICLKYIGDQCNDLYLVADPSGVWVVRYKTQDDGSKVPEKDPVSSLKVNAIKDIEFKGLSVDLGTKFVKIETPDGSLSGSIDELTVYIQSVYGLKRPDEFKFLLNKQYPKESGFYAVGPWFDGKQLTIATESLYNPAWKKLTEYRLPPEVPRDKKTEVLRRIIATVQSYRRPDIVTWILSYGLMANFAHYFRQVYGYFPNSVIEGRRQTGKTTLLALEQYLFWGNNPPPPIRPKSEAQLRQLLSQTTLITTIEDWRELESDSSQVEDMLSLLHSSAQTFVLRRISTSNKDVNGVYLALSAILADANYNKDIDTDTLDKVIFITIDKDEGVDVKRAEETDALLKNELRSDYSLHNVLHNIGIELLQIASEKLANTQLAKDRAGFLMSIINVGYQSWLEIFRRYNIELTSTVNGVKEFPYPTLETSTGESEEDLELAFFYFINEKSEDCSKKYGHPPESKSDIMKCGFFFDGSDVVVSYAFLREFIVWLEDNGFNARGVERIKKELGMKRTDFVIDGTTYYVYRKRMPVPTE